ncbi:hypothetical protein ACFQBQ_03400 [Granulicella cerasi]|uniref:NADH:flavin oxidoreductase/NADH oxidase N-terminal domain-containing protein n=1 Tax=Granulicella cerasi TaxID=741063 RepID=A0ABW1Z7K5_9BACT
MPFSEHYGTPIALEQADIQRIKQDFRRATERAFKAGFDLIELHAAHGYLFHQFLSSSSNKRTDEYGGSFENRIRFLLETIEVIREVWPTHLPLIVRLSATDWLEFSGETLHDACGWTMDETVRLTHILRTLGIDLVDVSSGGNQAKATIPVGPGYQTAFADRLRRECSIPTAAVGMITTPEQADHIIRSGQADLVLLARELLRNPYWPLEAAAALRHEIAWPVQYARAASGRKPERHPYQGRTDA